MGKLIDSIPPEVSEAVAESLRLFRQARFRNSSDPYQESQPLPSLLERCEQFISPSSQRPEEPIRLIHHFACTGGTIITKCLACSPNVHVLSEVDPLSSKTSSAGFFTPTDLIQLAQHGNRPISNEEKIQLFMASMGSLYAADIQKGLRLLIRDHTHSHFCVGDRLPERPTLGDMLSERYPTLSLVTVRHPLESWISLERNRWIEFDPPTIDEYAKRYLAFLDAYPQIKIIKYEDFVEKPDDLMVEMCSELGLPLRNDYQDLFMAHRFSGDSGRGGDAIGSRERRPEFESMLQAARSSSFFSALCTRLHYSI